jgi:cytochrome c oxidase subunit III
MTSPITSGAIKGHQTIDVSDLPAEVWDHRSPLWWGNLWGLVIETVVFGILVTVYFAVAMNLSPFPPPRADRLPVLYDSSPDLLFPTAALIVMLVSLAPAIWLDIAARRMDERTVILASFTTLAFNIALLVMRYYEFDALHFRWNDNAYGSITWTILGMHMIHLIVMASEDIYVLSWILKRGMDEKHAMDATVTAVYWYWIVATWILLYLLVYWAPRMI